MTHSSISAAVSKRNKFSSGFKFLGILLLVLLVSGKSWGATPYVMSGGNYSESFADIANWTNDFAAGAGASYWASVGIIGTGTSVTTGVRTTKSSATFATSTTGGIQKGTQALMFLSTGSGATPEAVAADLLLNFTNRNAGTLSFDWAAIDNASGTRPTSLRVFWSTDGTTFTEITGAQVIDVQSPTTGSISNVALPANFNNSATARLRFYNHAGTVTGSGNRDKISIDNVVVTSTANSPTITGAATASAFTTTYGTASAPQTFSISGSGLTADLVATAPTGFEVSSDGSTYGGTATFTQSGGSASGSLRIRLAATAAVAGTYNSQNIVLSSTSATSVNIVTAASGNTVSAKALTITGLTANSKPYDGNTTVSVTGSAAYSGLANGETISVSGSVSWAFPDAAVGAGKTLTRTGSYATPTNYSLTQPTLSASINAATAGAPNITGITGGDAQLTVAFDAPGFTGGVSITNYKYSIDNGLNYTAFSPAQTSSPLHITSGVSNNTAYDVLIKAVNSAGDGAASNSVSGTPVAPASPTISAVGTLSAVSTTYGTASASPTSFTVSGSAMSAGITVTPPAGFEVSTASDFSSNVGNSASPITIGAAGSISSTTIYVRLKASATYAGSPYSGNIVLTSTDATTVNVATASSTVTRVQLTITGLNGVNKPYDGGLSASFTGTAAYSGLVNSESFSVSGSPSASFATATAGDGKTITITGYNPPSTNYTLTNPTVTGNITTVGLTITGISAVSRVYNATNVATLTGTAAYVGLVNSESFTVSGTPSATFVDANVETAKAVTVTGYTAPSANYTVTQPTGLTADITKADQSITGVSASATKYVGDAYTFSAASTTSATNPLAYSSSDTNVATIDAATGAVLAKAVGTTTITVSQAGNANYNAATDATQTLTVSAAPTTLLVDDFTGSTTTLLTAVANGWTAHSGGGTNPITISSPTISYSGYLSSGVGNEITMTTSGEDVNKPLTVSKTSGSVYASFIVKVTAATTTGDYFAHFGATSGASVTTFGARVWAKKDTNGNLAFGISKSSTAANINYTGFNYTIGNTYLIVAKYNFVSGTTNDTEDLFVNPVLNSTESTPTISTSSADNLTADPTVLASFCLRQGGSGTAPAIVLDGIRVSTNWSDIVGEIPTFSGTGTWTDAARWNLGSAPGSSSEVVINGDATINSTVTVGSLTVNSGKSITINPTKQLTVSSTLVNNGTINLNSDATGTATILTPTSITGSGTANVQQYLTTGRNWYVSSPVSGATSNVFSASVGHPLYWYDEAHGTSAPWASITNTSTGLTVMKGYVANMAAAGVVTFSGALNTGSQSITIYRTGGQTKEGFNLLGNPYASYLDWDQISKTDLLTSIWYRTKTSGGAYTFDTYNSLGQQATGNGTKLVSNLIPPMQAFWVRVDVGKSQATISVDNSKRGHADNSSNGFKVKAVNTQPIVHLQVSNGVNADETIIYSNPNASDSYDAYDSPKMFSNSASLAEIYSVAGNEDLAINGLNSIPYDSEIALGFSTTASGSYSIKASQISNFAAGTQVILKDYATIVPVTTDLSDGSSYQFASDATSNNTSRFTLIFHAPSLATGFNTNNLGNVWVSANANGQIQINGNVSAETTVAVYNAIGQRVALKNLISNINVLDTRLVPGVYTVSITNNGKSTTTKVIVK